MHLVPAELLDRHMIDSERVCEAIGSLAPANELAEWAGRFALLGDTSRLRLLICIAEAGPICVTDLAVATRMDDARVSQLLRLLRTAGLVSSERDGRVVRYALADEKVRAVIPVARLSGVHRSA